MSVTAAETSATAGLSRGRLSAGATSGAERRFRLVHDQGPVDRRRKLRPNIGIGSTQIRVSGGDHHGANHRAARLKRGCPDAGCRDDFVQRIAQAAPLAPGHPSAQPVEVIGVQSDRDRCLWHEHTISHKHAINGSGALSRGLTCISVYVILVTFEVEAREWNRTAASETGTGLDTDCPRPPARGIAGIHVTAGV